MPGLVNNPFNNASHVVIERVQVGVIRRLKIFGPEYVHVVGENLSDLKDVGRVPEVLFSDPTNVDSLTSKTAANFLNEISGSSEIKSWALWTSFGIRVVFSLTCIFLAGVEEPSSDSSEAAYVWATSYTVDLGHPKKFIISL